MVIVGSEGGIIGGDACDNVCMLCTSICVIGVDVGMVLVCVGDGAGKILAVLTGILFLTLG